MYGDVNQTYCDLSAMYTNKESLCLYLKLTECYMSISQLHSLKKKENKK